MKKIITIIGIIFILFGLNSCGKKTKGKAQYKQECDAGILKGCLYFSYLTIYENYNNDVNAFEGCKIRDRIFPLYKKDCDINNNVNSCSQTGEMYHSSICGGPEHDWEQSTKYYKKACELGSEYSCEMSKINPNDEDKYFKEKENQPRLNKKFQEYKKETKGKESK